MTTTLNIIANKVKITIIIEHNNEDAVAVVKETPTETTANKSWSRSAWRLHNNENEDAVAVVKETNETTAHKSWSRSAWRLWRQKQARWWHNKGRDTYCENNWKCERRFKSEHTIYAEAIDNVKAVEGAVVGPAPSKPSNDTDCTGETLYQEANATVKAVEGAAPSQPSIDTDCPGDTSVPEVNTTAKAVEGPALSKPSIATDGTGDIATPEALSSDTDCTGDNPVLEVNSTVKAVEGPARSKPSIDTFGTTVASDGNDDFEGAGPWQLHCADCDAVCLHEKLRGTSFLCPECDETRTNMIACANCRGIICDQCYVAAKTC